MATTGLMATGAGSAKGGEGMKKLLYAAVLAVLLSPLAGCYVYPAGYYGYGGYYGGYGYPYGGYYGGYYNRPYPYGYNYPYRYYP
jgi:hypothetical protein